MKIDKRMYMVLYPNQSLIASHLEPEMFARHYTSGSSRHYSGKVIFAEIDINFRSDFLDIENVLNDLKPHHDGRPKSTKFISCYRVLEHIDLSAIGKLYITTQEGHCIALEQGPCMEHKDGFIRIFAEIDPMHMLVMSRLTPHHFGNYITNPKSHKGAPSQFFTQLNLDLVEFVKDLENNPFKPSPIASLHPSTIRDSYLELLDKPDKKTKGLALYSDMDCISYRHIRNGFTFASKGESLFYPMPSMRDIESTNLKFWRTM